MIRKNIFYPNKFCVPARSIGANVEEANQAQSKQDFIHKLSISQKESFETHYWLRLLRDSNFLISEQVNSMLQDCEELQKLITASIKTTKAKMVN